MTSQDAAWEALKLKREHERQALAAAQGVTLPTMPPRIEGETDRQYGVRLAGIAKSFCGPVRKASAPLRKLPSTGKAGKADKSNYQPSPPPDDGERLANMTTDPTTEDEP